MDEAAIGAENPTTNDTQPLKKPSLELYSLDKKAYSPPALGIDAPISP